MGLGYLHVELNSQFYFGVPSTENVFIPSSLSSATYPTELLIYYEYAYICVCDYVCVCSQRERERERESIFVMLLSSLNTSITACPTLENVFVCLFTWRPVSPLS